MQIEAIGKALNTPFGRFCYKVTPFGMKSAQEVFQKRISQHFSDLEGVENDIDDIIVHAETQVKHDQRLHSVLQRCEKINLTLNKENCVFKCKEVTYIGHKLTKSVPLTRCQHPLTKRELRDFLEQ